MVLKSNHARRASNAENDRPHRKRSSALGNTLRSTPRRRRARTTCEQKSSRYVLEQVKRSMSGSPTADVRFEGTPDIEMSDIDEAGPSSAPHKPAVTLPRYLGRPIYKEILKEVLVEIDPQLADVPLDYIQEGLEIVGPEMLQVLSSVQASPVKTKLPTEITFIINDLSSDLPTHMLAVYTRQSKISPGPIRQITLLPIHNIIMASHCAHLPMLPPSTPSPPDDVGEMTLPIVPLCLPSPETFSLLSTYLYTKDAYYLFSSLLPSGTSTPASLLCLDVDLDSDSSEIREFSGLLLTMYSPYVLFGRAMMVNALWRNVCALGIFDDQLWDVLDMAWELLLGGMGGREYDEYYPTSPPDMADAMV